jgi:fatty-acyl-CoA synthase
MKKNPPKEKLALEEYVGGSALKSLIEGFEKILELRSSSLGMTETSPLGTASRLQPKHTHLSENEN